MNDSLQAAIKEAFVTAPTSSVILHTLEIQQVGVQDSIYLVQSRRGITAYTDESTAHYFEPVGFQFALPPSNEEGFQSLTVSIDNINRVVSDFVEVARQSSTPVKILYRPYLSTDLTTPQMDPPLTLFLKEVQIDAHQVTGRATFMDIVNKKFPSDLYTRLRFPTLG